MSIHHEEQDEIEAYDMTTANIESGRFQWLDIIMRRWAYLLESTLFEKCGVLFEVSSLPVEWVSFEKVLGHIKVQQPIYIFSTEGHGEGLLLLHNKFVHACLTDNPTKLLQDQPSNLPPLNEKNQARIHQILSHLLKDFEKSWDGVEPMPITLKRITTHPSRAKLMRPFEKCVVGKLLFRTHGFVSDIVVCFPYLTLDSLLQKLTRRRVYPPESLDHYYSELKEHFQQLLTDTEYTIHAQLGTIEVGPKAKITNLEVGQILPLHSKVGADLTVCVNGTSVLTGELGAAEDHYAVRVTGKFEEKRLAFRKRPRAFKAIRWPQSK